MVKNRTTNKTLHTIKNSNCNFLKKLKKKKEKKVTTNLDALTKRLFSREVFKGIVSYSSCTQFQRFKSKTQGSSIVFMTHHLPSNFLIGLSERTMTRTHQGKGYWFSLNQIFIQFRLFFFFSSSLWFEIFLDKQTEHKFYTIFQISQMT